MENGAEALGAFGVDAAVDEQTNRMAVIPR
jgi:hypothetical protein